MNDRLKNCMPILVVLFFAFIVKNWAAVLPEFSDEQQNITQLQNENYNDQQQQQQRSKNQRIRHRSYDTKDDVAGIEADDVRSDNNHRSHDYDANDDVRDNNDNAVNSNHDQLSLHARQRRELSDWFIAPNTRWCGRGNSANNTYNHLGGASAADKCCRKHDHCHYFIGGMSNRYELFNYRPYTLSHCKCDRRFRTCLKMANDDDAKTIGKVFFNMIQTQCFVLKTERTCQHRAADGSCERENVKRKAYLRSNKRF